MKHANHVKAILVEEFAKAKNRNPQISLRSFAQRIGVSQAALSQIMNGKRPLTAKTAKNILISFGLNPKHAEEELEAHKQNEYAPIDADKFSAIAEWFHFAILSLANTEGFRSDANWIGKRLGIQSCVAKNAVDRLIRLNLLRQKGRKIVTTEKNFEAIYQVPNTALRSANTDNLQLAMKSMATDLVADRDFTSITLCFDPHRIDEARTLIKNFRRSFDKTMESGKKKEVFKLCIQLFPLSH